MMTRIAFALVFSLCLFSYVRCECMIIPTCARTDHENDVACTDPNYFIRPPVCINEANREFDEKYAIAFAIDGTGYMKNQRQRPETAFTFMTNVVEEFHNLDVDNENQYIFFEYGSHTNQPSIQPIDPLWELYDNFETTIANPPDMIDEVEVSIDVGLQRAAYLFDRLEENNPDTQYRKLLFLISASRGGYSHAGTGSFYGQAVHLSPPIEQLYNRNVEVTAFGINQDYSEEAMLGYHDMTQYTGGVPMGTIELPVSEWSCRRSDGSREYWSEFTQMWKQYMPIITKAVTRHITRCLDSCPAGYSCDNPSQPVPCAEGEYSPKGSNQCFSCIIEKNEPTNNYYVAGAQEDRGTCFHCPIGTRATDSVDGCVKNNVCEPTFQPPLVGHHDVLDGITDWACGGGCADCSVGFYAEPADVNCMPCPAGTINTDKTGCRDGKDACCTRCDAGHWSNIGSTQCYECPPNHFQSGKNSSPGCMPCTMYDSESSNYSTQILGKGDPLSGQTVCHKCSSDLPYVPHSGASCQACPSNSSFSDKHNTCLRTNCSAGEYAISSTLCDRCPFDYIAPNPGSFECEKCPDGQYQKDNGIECGHRCSAGYKLFVPNLGDPSDYVCEACPKGSYSSTVDSDICTPCAMNEYSDSDASNSCTPCPNGYSTNGKTGQSECTSKNGGSGDNNGGNDSSKSQSNDDSGLSTMYYVYVGVSIIICVGAFFGLKQYRKKHGDYKRYVGDEYEAEPLML